MYVHRDAHEHSRVIRHPASHESFGNTRMNSVDNNGSKQKWVQEFQTIRTRACCSRDENITSGGEEPARG